MGEKLRYASFVLFFVLLYSLAACAADVLSLKPAGLWRCDDGQGGRIGDYSGNDNHGSMFQVSWEEGLANFTGAYQFIEIPAASRYMAKDFSIGGWVFIRQEVFGGLYPGWAGMTFFGNAYHTSGYNLENLYDENCLFLKSKWSVPGGAEEGVSILIRKDRKVDIISGGRDEALCAKADSPSVEIGKWQHILYTYKAGAELEGGLKWKEQQSSLQFYGAGTARLYINGQLAVSKDNVAYKPRDARFLVGSDAVWWLQSDKSGSLNGSVRDMVLFDRALTNEQAQRLYETTMPQKSPRCYNSYSLIIGGKEVGLSLIPSLPAEKLDEAIIKLNQFNKDDLAKISLELTDALSKININYPCCDDIVGLLSKINTDYSLKTAEKILYACSEILRDGSIDGDEKIGAIAALTYADKFSDADIAALSDMLEGFKNQGCYIPRVEDGLRNSVIAALLKVERSNQTVRRLLGEVFAKPILDKVDMSASVFEQAAALYGKGDFMGALDIYRKLPLKNIDERFFSQGDKYRDRRDWQANSRAYTPMAEYGDCVYKMGNGLPWQGVENLSRAEYEKIMESMSAKYPKARQWRSPDAANLCRATVSKFSADGSEQKIYIGGESFVFDGTDQKLRGWAIAVDTEGYIHIIGAMHNAPVPANFLPGTWDALGISEDFTSDDYPTVMYWVSKRPQSIDEFEFVGKRREPRNIPTAMGLNYMNFIQDNNGKLYIYGRVYVQGVQSWGFYVYDTSSQRWAAIGGYAPDVKTQYPQWASHLAEYAADWIALPTLRWRNDLPQCKALAWARQPHFYNYIRGWGIRFDKNNRMYVSVSLFGLDGDNVNVNSELFAYSDDGGASFYRTDGSNVSLPLSVNPEAAGNANINLNFARKRIELWYWLISYAGYATVR